MLRKPSASSETKRSDQTAELVRAARRGDEDAFVCLMSEQKEKLYRMAFSFLKNEADALEAIQETTFRAYTKLGTLRDPQFFGTWVMRILMNVCINEKNRRSKQTSLVIDPDVSESSAVDPARRLSIEMALEHLEPKYRQIIILKYFEDWTIREIAQALRRPDSTIKTYLYKALKGLRGKLRIEGESER